MQFPQRLSPATITTTCARCFPTTPPDGRVSFFQITHSLVQVLDEAGLRTFAIETDRIAPVAWMPGAARGRGCRNGAPRSRVLDVEDRRSARARALVT